LTALALDTATPALGLSLRSGEDTRTVLLQAGFRHSETLLPQIERLLAEAGLKPPELELIVCSLGPGSFTGIRIGLATAKGLAFGARSAGSRCELLGASTLDGLAWRYRAFPGAVVAANASLRRRYHAAVYLQGRRQGEYLEAELEELGDRLGAHRRLLLTGSGAEALHRLLAPSREAEAVVLDWSGLPCDPVGLLEQGLELFGRQGASGELKPLYLRKSEAEIRRGEGS
jgi:tRNA threonylcarbamoyladenosine biosynthesis protein TsaB